MFDAPLPPAGKFAVVFDVFQFPKCPEIFGNAYKAVQQAFKNTVPVGVLVIAPTSQLSCLICAVEISIIRVVNPDFSSSI